MREIHVLLPEDDAGVSRGLRELLSSCEDILVTAPAGPPKDLPDQVRESHAQVLLLVLKDGQPDTGMLQSLQEQRTEVLVCTCFSSRPLAERLRELGVGQLISLPCSSQALEEHIRLAALGELPGRGGTDYLERRAGQLLQRMGLSPVRKSYRYLCKAICLWVEEGEEHAGVTKWIYPCVGKHLGATGSAVERCIRQTIQRLWSRPLTPAQTSFFPDDVLMGRDCPTNAQFISTLARVIRESWGEMVI